MCRHLFVCAGASIHSVAILHYLFVPTLLARHGVSLQALVDSELMASTTNLTGAAGEPSLPVTSSSIDANIASAIEAALECDPIDRALIGQYALFARALCSIPTGLPLCTLNLQFSSQVQTDVIITRCCMVLFIFNLFFQRDNLEFYIFCTLSAIAFLILCAFYCKQN